jgi:hypothetical protein
MLAGNYSNGLYGNTFTYCEGCQTQQDPPKNKKQTLTKNTTANSTTNNTNHPHWGMFGGVDPTEAGKAFNKYFSKIHIGVKTSIGLQLGLKSPFGTFEFAPITTRLTNASMTFANGKMTQNDVTFLNTSFNGMTTATSFGNTLTLDSNIGFTPFQTGFEASQAFKVDAGLTPSNYQSSVKASFLGYQNSIDNAGNKSRGFEVNYSIKAIFGVDFSLKVGE